MSHEKNQSRILNAWASYDWANSVYNLTITAAIFPVYYDIATRLAHGGKFVEDKIVGGDEIDFFGLSIESSILYDFSIGASFILAAILSPLLSGLADYGGYKKNYMKFFTYMGASACFGLFFFNGSNVEWGIIMAILASMGFSGAIVFYISFLPEIASDDKLDSVSAKGFSLGFLGSVIQLFISLLIISYHESLGISEDLATRLSFLSVSIWWVCFAQIAFYYLPSNPPKPGAEKGNLMSKGFQEINKVWQSLKDLPNLKRFLLAFFLYNMGAQSIFLLATIFGSNELNLPSDRLIGTILLLQLVGIGGAYFFSYISKLRGNKFSLISMLICWFGISIFGYFVQSEYDFYTLAIVFGFVMGGIHLSRSTYAKLIPEDTEDTTSYFSFYDVMEKLATAIGPISYGIIAYFTGNVRYSILALGIYFILGLLILATVQIPRGEVITTSA